MSKETYMIESLTRDLITQVMEDQHLSWREAMDVVYRSKTFAALNDLSTGLYFQSVAYVYEDLADELKKNASDK